MRSSSTLRSGILIGLLLSVSAGVVQAQESAFPSLDGIEAERSGGGSPSNETLPELESKNKQSYPPVLKDTLFVRPAPQKPKAVDVKAADKPTKSDDVLSFNFLYYIIQKYKLGDIID